MTDPRQAATSPPAGAARAAYASPETRSLDLGPLELELGGRLPGVTVGYRTWGTLDADGANAVVVCHALTGSADADLWWTRLFGPGRALDPGRDFVVCANILGSCYGTTGPTSLDPATGEPWHGTFPAITVRDMVRVQHALCERLGVRRIRLVIGGSLGGMQTLEWGLCYPDLVEAMVFIASTARHSAWAIGLGEAQRQAIAADPRWRDGRYPASDPPAAGLAAARAMAMLSYRSFPSFEERFARRTQAADLYAVESYLRYQGQQLVDRFDPATYVALTRAMDTHDVSRGRGDFEEVLRAVRQPTLVVSIDSDVLYWPAEQREVARLVPGARLAVMDSPHGHDAFLIDVDRLNDMVADFRGRPRVAAAGDALERAYAEKGRSLLVLGKGKVGAALLDQLAAQRPGLERDYDVVLRLAGLADRRGACFDEAGVDLARWREALAAAPERGPIDPASAPALLDRLARLPGPVLLDLTAADGMEEVYEQAFRRGIDVIGANKLPLAVPGRRLLALREARRQHQRRFAYDTAVGASLPVLDTLRKLVQAGDRVVRIEGSLSGTLGYLCAELQKGVPLSMATRWAAGLGYAEADPRDDLSGLDSARKALILAREAGLTLELADVVVTPFVPLALLEPVGLVASLRRHDATMAAEVERLGRAGKALRYLTTILPSGDGLARVAVEPAVVDLSHPAARLTGVEAFVAFTTLRPGKVGPPRAVPATIARPDYADGSRPRPGVRDVRTPEEVERLRRACRAAARVLRIGGEAVRPGVTTDALDELCHEETIRLGGYPSPLNYRGFPRSICTSPNEVICHGIPDSRVLEAGDIVNLDITVYLDGMHGDCSATFLVGEVDEAGRRLVRVARECLERGITAVKPGLPVGVIGQAIEPHAARHGYGVVRDYCGHGIGDTFHTSLQIPHHQDPRARRIMEPGMTFTIEPMITEGGWEAGLWPDGWTAVTADGRRSAQFEHTLLVTTSGAEILTVE